MPRFSLHSLPNDQRTQLIAEFNDAIASLKSRVEVKKFLRDLLSPSEVAMLMRRIEIAALLIAGYPQRSIQEMTGIGKATLLSIRNKMKRRDRGDGYVLVVKRLMEVRKRRMQQARRKATVDPLSMRNVKNKYRLYYLLDHIFEEIQLHRERKSKAFIKAAIKRTPSRK